MIRNLYLFSLLLLFVQCESTVSIDGFDAELWKSDPNGCQGQRKDLLAPLKNGKEDLKSLNTADIDRYLGNPDSKDLDKRNRMYYRYDISGSAKCNSDTVQVYLQIRFNAIDRADELIIFE